MSETISPEDLETDLRRIAGSEERFASADVAEAIYAHEVERVYRLPAGQVILAEDTRNGRFHAPETEDAAALKEQTAEHLEGAFVDAALACLRGGTLATSQNRLLRQYLGFPDGEAIAIHDIDVAFRSYMGVMGAVRRAHIMRTSLQRASAERRLIQQGQGPSQDKLPFWNLYWVEHQLA